MSYLPFEVLGMLSETASTGLRMQLCRGPILQRFSVGPRVLIKTREGVKAGRVE